MLMFFTAEHPAVLKPREILMHICCLTTGISTRMPYMNVLKAHVSPCDTSDKLSMHSDY